MCYTIIGITIKMILRSSLAIISDEFENLETIDSMLMDDSILDDMVESLDSINELEKDDTRVYRCETNEDMWINIYEVLQRFDGKAQDVILASTDGKTFVEVLSTSGLFDVYVDSSLDKIEELCETYGLEFFGSSGEDDYEEQDEEDEWN